MSSLLISSSFLAAASFAMAFLVTESVLILIRKGKLATLSPPFLAWKITLGVSFVAVLSVLLIGLCCTHLYGVCAIVWGFHGAVMQQAAHWLNTSKWRAEKREKAAKADEERSLQTQLQELRQQVLALTSRILAVERTNAELERDITMLQKVALDKDSKS
ncbi:unnamed protein product [Penicillium discolor]